MRIPLPVFAPARAACLVLAAALLPVAVARAGDGAPPPVRGGDASLDQARRRWDALPPEKRTALLRKFREFQSMPEEKRAALRERFRRLGGTEGVSGLGAGLRSLRRDAPERVDELRRRGEAARLIEARVLESLPPDLVRRMGALAPEEREILRRRVLHAATDAVRRSLTERFATEEERQAVASGDVDARAAAHAAVFRRARETILESHRAALESLPPDQRPSAAHRAFVDAAWEAVRPVVPEVSRAVEKALRQSPSEREADLTERLRRHAGLRPDEVRAPGGTRRILGTLLLVPQDRRAEAKKALREGLRALEGLPEDEGRRGFESLLRRLVVEYGPAPPAPGQNDR